jgi:hypothetical protein
MRVVGYWHTARTLADIVDNDAISGHHRRERSAIPDRTAALERLTPGDVYHPVR